MILNDAGEIADCCWLQIPEHFPDVILHEHIVMPNHIHGIIELNKPVVVGVQNFEPLQSLNDLSIPVGVENFQPLPSINENFTPQQSKNENLNPAGMNIKK